MFLLYHKTTRPTGKVLARALGFSGFGTCKTLTPQRRVDFLLRWGNSDDPGRDLLVPHIQTSEAIRTASHKLVAFRRMAGSGVRVPRHTASVDEAATWGTVVFGRTVHGSKGAGITVYQPGTAARGHALYTEFIPNPREYRIHVVGGKVVRTQRKYLEREVVNRNDYIKNHENGYVFKQPQQGLNRSRTEMAVAAVEALGLDFGAVDMVIDGEGREYVLEVNTAPACSPLTARCYVEALAPLIRERSNGVVQPVVHLEVLEALAGD